MAGWYAGLSSQLALQQRMAWLQGHEGAQGKWSGVMSQRSGFTHSFCFRMVFLASQHSQMKNNHLHRTQLSPQLRHAAHLACFPETEQKLGWKSFQHDLGLPWGWHSRALLQPVVGLAADCGSAHLWHPGQHCSTLPAQDRTILSGSASVAFCCLSRERNLLAGPKSKDLAYKSQGFD